jgi:hypothetical protein
MKTIPNILLSILLVLSIMTPYTAALAMYPVPSGGGTPVYTQISAVPAKSTNLAGSVISSRLKTVRVRKDTVLRVRLLQDINTATVREGEAFNASLDEALYASEGRILLPKGSVFRGRVVEVTPNKFFGKGASFRLDFDHVTLPNGEVQPIALQVGTVNQMPNVVKPDGVIYQDPGYGQKFANTLDKSGYIISGITRKGYEAGAESGGKGLGIVTGFFSAIGGGVAGAGYLVGKSVYHAVAKGDKAEITPDDALYVELLADTDIALN